jgi:hypothetical protein
MYLPNIYMILHSHGPGHYITCKPIYFTLTDSQSYMISNGLYMIIHLFLHIWGYTITQTWLRFHTLTVLWSVGLLLYYTLSISSSAQYVILHNKISWRKVKICRFGSRKWFWLCLIAQFAVPVKRPSNVVHLQKRVYWIWSDCWLVFLIGPSHNDWSRWFAISSPPPMCYPSFHFMGEAAE